MKKRLLLPWRTRTTPRPSVYKRQLLEKKRVQVHYNVKDYQLRAYMKEAFKKGVEYPCDRALQILESRLDCFVWRVGLAPTMAGARWFVVRGGIQILYPEENKGDEDRLSNKVIYRPRRTPNNGIYTNDWTTNNVPATRLEVGCRIRVNPLEWCQTRGRTAHEDETNIELPANIEWDREKMEGSYNDVCDWQEFSIHVDEAHFLNWFKMPRGVRRTHKRYFLGTDIIIRKRYDGRVRPTPENIINMKRGLGLNRKGRARPPCLWGRKYPINNPFQASKKSILDFSRAAKEMHYGKDF
jgi:ribosomal protein S4